MAAETDRRILWLPVFFGGGIALYFSLTVEPPIWLGLVVALMAAGAALLVRRHVRWRTVALCLLVVAAGFALIAGKRGAIDAAVTDAVASVGDRRPASWAGRRLCIFHGVRRADPHTADRAALPDQEDRGRGDPLVVLTYYLMPSGAAIPTERAIVFAAILIERLRISMRICAIAAAVVSLLQRESLIRVSF